MKDGEAYTIIDQLSANLETLQEVCEESCQVLMRKSVVLSRMDMCRTLMKSVALSRKDMLVVLRNALGDVEVTPHNSQGPMSREDVR